MQPIVNNSNCVFHKETHCIITLLGLSTATADKIETFMKNLTKGPLIAYGNFGPKAYNEEPFQLKNKFHNFNIFGWKPNASRKNEAINISIMVLGAKKTIKDGLIFFKIAKKGMSLEIVHHLLPSVKDKKIYVTTYTTFKTHLSHIYLDAEYPDPRNSSCIYILSSAPRKKPILDDSKKTYVTSLLNLPLESILDNSNGEAHCRAIGEEIFQRYKTEAHGDSFAGKKAMQDICDSVFYELPDGKIRKQCIERAWDRIGDENWRWMA